MQNWQPGRHRNGCSALELFISLFSFPPLTFYLSLSILLHVINHHVCSLLEKILASLVVVGKQLEQCCINSRLLCCCTSNHSHLWFQVSVAASLGCNVSQVLYWHTVFRVAPLRFPCSAVLLELRLIWLYFISHIIYVCCASIVKFRMSFLINIRFSLYLFFFGFIFYYGLLWI